MERGQDDGQVRAKDLPGQAVELREDYKRTAHEATSMTTDGSDRLRGGLFDDTNRLEALLAEEPADTASTSDSPA